MSDILNIYINDINKFKLLTKDEELAIAIRMNKGEEKAKKEMIEHNLRLVVNIAKKYIRKGYPIMDLIEEGNIGLMKAVDKYDYTKGNRFSTYASWWIKQYILREMINKSKMIRIPVHITEVINKLINAKKRLETEYKNEPTLFELADECEIPIDKAIDCLSAYNINILSFSEILIKGENQSSNDINVEECLKSNDDIERYDNKDFINKIIILLNSKDISERDKRIFKQRVGVGCNNMTLEEIGNMNGISREAVRQIVEKIRNKLSQSSKLLYGY